MHSANNFQDCLDYLIATSNTLPNIFTSVKPKMHSSKNGHYMHIVPSKQHKALIRISKFEKVNLNHRLSRVAPFRNNVIGHKHIFSRKAM